MKNIYLFFIFLLLTGCGYNLISNSKAIPILCPPIFFGSGHKFYIGSSIENISLDNIEYKGEINNAIFSKECFLNNNIFSSELSILFIVQPLVEGINSVDMPFYLAVLNNNKELQDMLYFSFTSNLKKDLETNKTIETDMTAVLTLRHESINENSIIIIGYILDEKRKEILN